MGGEPYRVDPQTQPAVIAAADLVERSGGREFQIGYLYDEGDPEFDERGPCWYASVTYRGARLFSEDHPMPAPACDHLAAQILDGGMCQFCQRRTVVSTTPTGQFVPARGGDCIWRRDDDVWLAGCGGQPSSRHGMNRARRRAAEKKERRRR